MIDVLINRAGKVSTILIILQKLNYVNYKKNKNTVNEGTTSYTLYGDSELASGL